MANSPSMRPPRISDPVVFADVSKLTTSIKSLCFATTALSLAALGLAGVGSLHRERPTVFHEENILGTSFEFKAVAWSRDVAAQAESAALTQIAQDAALLSSWDANSEFSRWF